jgi:hypothetical protein
MQTWLLITIISVAAVMLIAGIIIGAIVLWRRQIRNSLIQLTGRREAITYAYKALEAVFTSLAAGSSEELAQFAVDPTSPHRRALDELHTRMRMLSEEMSGMPLPKKLWHTADLLSQAGAKLAAEAGKVGQAEGPEAVLAALGGIDVTGIRTSLQLANVELDRLLAENKLEECAVYGGGMYI